MEGRSLGRYDRYILSQLVVLFGFFSLVLISVYWINGVFFPTSPLINLIL